MTTLDVAHLRIQGVNVVIAFLDSSFGNKGNIQQSQVHAQIQMRARQAGLAGNVVIMWQDSFGSVSFRAPTNQHAYFRTADYETLFQQRNKRLSWS